MCIRDSPNMMQRALHNLLGNAMHHIGKDGIFILRAQRCTCLLYTSRCV